jgi:hypothetical protein
MLSSWNEEAFLMDVLISKPLLPSSFSLKSLSKKFLWNGFSGLSVGLYSTRSLDL